MKIKNDSGVLSIVNKKTGLIKSCRNPFKTFSKFHASILSHERNFTFYIQFV